VPSSTLAARSRRDSTLRWDKPAARSASVLAGSTCSGETSSFRAAMRRPWMARAATPASCWYTIERTSVRVTLGQLECRQPVASGQATGSAFLLLGASVSVSAFALALAWLRAARKRCCAPCLVSP